MYKIGFDLEEVSLTLDQRILGSYIFMGFIGLIILVSLVFLVIHIRRGHEYKTESLPTLVDLNLALPEEEDKDEQEEVVEISEAASAFAFDDEDDNIGEANDLLLEAQAASQSAQKMRPRKQKSFWKLNKK